MPLETARAVRRTASPALLLLGGALAACSGGGSSSPACLLAADCTLPPGATCRVPACDQGTCGSGPAPAGTSCPAGLCDGAGACVACLGPADCPTPAVCTVRTCTSGACGATDAPQGTACGASGACDGAGQCVAPCASPADCPGADGECRTRTCVAGQCGVSDAPAGTAVASQVAGDCHVNQCDGAGNVTSVVAPGDLPVDGNDCTLDLCTAGTPSNPPAPAGTACAGGVCDGAGACVALNGCAPADFVDLTAQPSATVTFGAAFAYSPACLRVRAGTPVTFTGDFTFHPLQGGTVVGLVAYPATSGPFVPATTTGTTRTFTPPEAGDFPYYCAVHFASGMAGVLSVVP